jgi:hypothetical protein
MGSAGKYEPSCNTFLKRLCVIVIAPLRALGPLLYLISNWTQPVGENLLKIGAPKRTPLKEHSKSSEVMQNFEIAFNIHIPDKTFCFAN